ncbi:MAG: diaminopimelate decarboxylase, partial [Chthoniobacterales bacterium]|nr:diaminopimelate decarboxylase [Chthoniobacterales bacterium]
MPFTYRNKQLACDGIDIAGIAAEVGTPFYLYSARGFQENFAAYETAFAGSGTAICFAVKSCSNIAILK